MDEIDGIAMDRGEQAEREGDAAEDAEKWADMREQRNDRVWVEIGGADARERDREVRGWRRLDNHRHEGCRRGPGDGHHGDRREDHGRGLRKEGRGLDGRGFGRCGEGRAPVLRKGRGESAFRGAQGGRCCTLGCGRRWSGEGRGKRGFPEGVCIHNFCACPRAKIGRCALRS